MEERRLEKSPEQACNAENRGGSPHRLKFSIYHQIGRLQHMMRQEPHAVRAYQLDDLAAIKAMSDRYRALAKTFTEGVVP